ncbi:Atxe2 family lasso peptide isopeptidase [Asticcacaulis sp.]|uniref:Atxe2 family lasso peptide isopeptidase n=1 Tax=Asticcacaulis sp. TaxID=1872648 RepID=UPI002C623286|nr:Atxe2 family lasso peptide isopeptidase [Asticcacaulis sp.]HTM81565.1 Atxe2 family lasso peptide isopeptidase [Asticcacaulis sp.]
MARSKYALLVGVACACFGVASVRAEICTNVLPSQSVVPAPTAGAVTPRDLVELRDIGPNMIDNSTAEMFSISPDGSRVAFQMQQGKADANTYCFSLAVKPLKGGQAKVLDRGGEFIKRTFTSDGYALGVPGGIGLETQPLWSPDGSKIAFLRRDAGVTQVWLVESDGSNAKPLTKGEVNVDAFAWTRNGKAVVIASRPGLNAFQEALEAEGRQGLLYDERWVPGAYNRPLAREPIPTVYTVVDLMSGSSMAAIAEEREQLEPSPDPRRPANAIQFAAKEDGMVAWTTPIEDTIVRPRTMLTVVRGGKTEQCRETFCSGIVALWWTKDHTLLFLRNEGVPSGKMAIYHWGKEEGPKLVLATRSYLTGCQLRDIYLYCREESSLQPGRIVSISLTDGRVDPIYDPNPEFSALKLGPVERLHWTNNVGIETWGDLVLPPHRTLGEKLPLIIVQYTSNGFLRGGTGDEFPIQVLAAHGFAVLSVQRPLYLGMKLGAKTWDEVNRLDMADWGDRKSVLSSFETVVNLLAARGEIDPARVGITGLSDGASSAQFAILNSHLFRAAAMAQCCEEESSPSLLAGSVFGAWFHGMGYPKLTEEGKSFWAPMSIRANAARLNTPILMQVSDIEYLGVLEGYVALKEQNKPVELYVFPDDNHVKWQPAHRLAAYTRYVDWFDFWLRDVEDPDPAKAAQYQRWRQMKTTH